MKALTTLALQLLQATQALLDSVQSGELEQLDALQQQRASLVAELDDLSQQDWPEGVKVECRALVERTRQLEQEVIRIMTEKRDAIGREHDQLQRNQQARKAYGSFS